MSQIFASLIDEETGKVTSRTVVLDSEVNKFTFIDASDDGVVLFVEHNNGANMTVYVEDDMDGIYIHGLPD